MVPRAHREHSRARGKRIQVYPAKTRRGRKKESHAPLPPPRHSPLRRPCVSSRIVSRKQKTGSLCPSSPSPRIQKHTKFSLKCSSSSSSSCPVRRTSFSLSALPYISPRALDSPALSRPLSPYSKTAATLLLLSRASLFFLPPGPYLDGFLFLYSLYILVCTLTRSNSRLHPSLSQIPLIPLAPCNSAFAFLVSARPGRRSPGDEVSRRLVKVFFFFFFFFLTVSFEETL